MGSRQRQSRPNVLQAPSCNDQLHPRLVPWPGSVVPDIEQTVDSEVTSRARHRSCAALIRDVGGRQRSGAR